LNYVYRGAGRVGRATVYRSDLKRLLRPGGVFFDGQANAEGFELEWTQEVTPRLKVSANTSHVDTTDPRSPTGHNEVSASWLGNAMLLYHAAHNIVIGGRFNYIGDRGAGAGYDAIDLTVTRQDAFVPGLSLRVGVKDMFNGQPSYLTQLPVGGVVTNTYPGRSGWVEISWKP